MVLFGEGNGHRAELLRVQTGIVRQSDGWHVIVRTTHVGPSPRIVVAVYDPPMSEEEAERTSRALARGIRLDAAAAGLLTAELGLREREEGAS